MVQVNVNEGILEGELVNNEYGGKFYSFKGIPYADPPVGDLRFKAPQPPKPWNGIRSANEFGPVCYQIDFAINSNPIGSEDCLYLNVYTPELNPVKPMPVMLYIHGGAFLSGSGNDDMTGPEFLVKHNVIIVTINYRLGALGFLCLDTEDIPGNAGMKDQVAAMRWVNKNISNFGGDPNNVTIFGESAGAGSVSFHLISPLTKGLFRKAIAQSGALTCWWAQAFKPRDHALSLAKQLGFYSEDDKKLSDFFKSLPLEKLVQLDLSNILGFSKKEFLNIYFNIVSEKPFGHERYFHGDVYDVLRNTGIHADVELMAGYTEDEGYVGLCGINIERLIEQLNTMNDFCVPKQIALNVPLTKQLDVARKFKSFYFKNQEITMDNLDKYINYLSMDMFIVGAIQLAKIIAKQKKNKVFFYKFTCKSERNRLATEYLGLKEDMFENRQVVCHSDDLAYLFPVR
uniref:Carboxylic ester hydrolase n=1 Tax=Plodia interpunctella TaxID=58824 RepID=A0A5B8R860_PLOIN|nr:carboxylesterase [Plodia interpunctella]